MSRTPSFAPPASRSLGFGLIAIVIGFVVLIVGVPGRSDERALARKGLVVEGTVVEKRIDHVTRRKKGGSADERTLYVVHYRFPIGSGVVQEGEQAVREPFWRGLRQAGPIAIRYLETNPSANRVDAEPGTDVALVIGGVVAASGLILLIAAARKARHPMAGKTMLC